MSSFFEVGVHALWRLMGTAEAFALQVSLKPHIIKLLNQKLVFSSYTDTLKFDVFPSQQKFSKKSCKMLRLNGKK